ncbi:MAG: hypothetical protein JSV54_01800 [Chloroflexota bacterium]|nr:MAG: hypothetical protein JSV54_01800 [Chloroflexota bacterium]
MNSRNKSYRLVVCLTIALSLVAVSLVGCGEKEPTISEVVMSMAVDDNGRPLDNTTVFTPDTGALFCSFKLSNLPVGSRLKAELIYIDGEEVEETGPNYVVWENTGTIERKGIGYSYTVFTHPPIPGYEYQWPRGDYKIVLSVDEQEKAVAYFKVE